MIRAFSFSTGLGLCIALAAFQASAQGAAPAPAPAAAAPAAAAPAAPAAPPPAAPPYYGPPQGEPPPGWGPPPGYAGGWRAQPIEMKYVEGKPIPPGYHIETRVRKGLVVAGPIIFGVPYLLSMSVAASSRAEPDRWLYAPVFGPFVDLASRNNDCDPNGTSGSSSTFVCSVNDSSSRFFLMLDGLMQTGGATMLILGLALPQTLLVRDDAPYIGQNKSHFAWTISPYSMGRSGAGLGVVGTF